MHYEAWAVSALGLEPLVAAELTPFGVSKISPSTGGVGFRCDGQGLARAQLGIRVASRVVVRVASFHAAAFSELEKHARRVEWARFLTPDASFRLRVTCKKSKLYHSDAVAQRVAAEVMRTVQGARVDEENGQLFVVRIDHDLCTISADASGELLHRRGYRQAVGKAPLRETLAAAMIAGVSWDPRTPLVDPMCGSGTLPIEAAMRARKIAPGLRRTFAAEQWPETAAGDWKVAREKATARVLPAAPAPICGSDRDAGAIEAAKANAERAGVAGDIEFTVRAISALEVPAGQGLRIANPPYGVRVGETEALRDLFARLGQVARAKCSGWRVALLSADRGLDAQTQLPFRDVFETSNGGIPVRLILADVTREA